MICLICDREIRNQKSAVSNELITHNSELRTGNSPGWVVVPERGGQIRRVRLSNGCVYRIGVEAHDRAAVYLVEMYRALYPHPGVLGYGAAVLPLHQHGNALRVGGAVVHNEAGRQEVARRYIGGPDHKADQVSLLP